MGENGFLFSKGMELPNYESAVGRPRNSPKRARKLATTSTRRNPRSWSKFLTKISCQTVTSGGNDNKYFSQTKYPAGHAARVLVQAYNAVMFQ